MSIILIKNNVAVWLRECKKFTNGKRILIVDDDEDISNLFKTYLEYDVGYTIDAFFSS